MPKVESELKLLREEQRRLATAISRFSFVSLALVLLFVIAFSRAYDQIDVSDVRRQVAEVRRLGRISSKGPDLSYVYLLFPESALAIDTKQYSVAEQVAARNSRLALEKSLEEQAKKWFMVKISALGSDLEFDLRYWIFFLPLLLWASALRLGILTEKEQAVKDIAANIVTKSDAKEITRLDRLLFGDTPGSATPYARQPVRIERLAYISCLTISLVYLFVEGWHFWRLWGPANLLKIAGVLASITFYLYIYGRAVRLSIASQAQTFTEVTPYRHRFVKTREFLKRFADRTFSPVRRRPRLSISTGSLLVVLTLFLGVARSCDSDSTRYTGYDLLRHKDSGFALWPVYGFSDLGVMVSAFKYSPLTPIGIWSYYASLGMTALSILLLALSIFKKTGVLQMRRTIKFFYRLAVLLLLGLFADISVGYWFSGPTQANSENVVASAIDRVAFIIIDAGRIIFCIIPFYLWLRSTSRRAPPNSAVRFKSVITTIYLPALVSAFIAIPHLIYSEFSGIPLLFFGLSLLALGYNGLASLLIYPPKTSQLEQKGQISG